jgi:NADH-quinone oxidoreductase subunit J
MDDRTVKVPLSRFWIGLITAAAGFVVCAFLILKNAFKEQVFEYGEVKMDVVGKSILGMDKFQYLLPFELMGLLLLACVIGAIVIARKR